MPKEDFLFLVNKYAQTNITKVKIIIFLKYRVFVMPKTSSINTIWAKQITNNANKESIKYLIPKALYTIRNAQAKISKFMNKKTNIELVPIAQHINKSN
jgi:hypothetical protein